MPLEEWDADLARDFVGRLVDQFLTGAKLQPTHRDEAIENTSVKVEDSGDGGDSLWLEVELPLGCGYKATVWDGTREGAMQIADNVAERAAEEVVWDQQNVGPTGWE